MVAALAVLAGGARADGDADGDRVPDAVDNCPKVFNPDQDDQDNDGIGTTCDSTKGVPDSLSYVVLYLRDQRGRPIVNACFNTTVVTTQGSESDEICTSPISPGYVIVALQAPDDLRVDIEQTEAPADCSGGLTGTRTHSFTAGSWEVVNLHYTCSGAGSDGDADGVPNTADNCPRAFNPDQVDEDTDGVGNTCD